MLAGTSTTEKAKRASLPERIAKLSADLIDARFVTRDFKESVKIGKEFAPLLESAHWNHPEVFSEPQVRAACSFVAWLKKAKYITAQRNNVYRGGAPGLGKRA